MCPVFVINNVASQSNKVEGTDRPVVCHRREKVGKGMTIHTVWSGQNTHTHTHDYCTFTLIFTLFQQVFHWIS